MDTKVFVEVDPNAGYTVGVSYVRNKPVPPGESPQPLGIELDKPPSDEFVVKPGEKKIWWLGNFDGALYIREIH